MEKHYPAGKTSYLETHCLICMAIAELIDNEHSIVNKRYLTQGIGGIFELAEELTDEFEKLHSEEEWIEKDYFEEIDSFLHSKGVIKYSPD